MKLKELENVVEGTILLEKDKITKARDLENSLVAAWNGDEPNSFQQLSKAITDALKPQIKGTAEMVATQPITKRWIKYGCRTRQARK
jgi:DNA-binding NtrC family response regulator